MAKNMSMEWRVIHRQNGPSSDRSRNENNRNNLKIMAYFPALKMVVKMTTFTTHFTTNFQQKEDIKRVAPAESG
jgi:hypothetical protein